MTDKSPWQLNDIDRALINLALQEDLGPSMVDATTDSLFPDQNITYQAHIVSKHPKPIIVCGIAVLQAILQSLDAQAQFTVHVKDGESLQPGQTMITMSAHAKALLAAERTILNFLRHLSAIATLTNEFVQLVQVSHCKILDTRKTTPGMRHLEKYAVYCGGGVNHRMGLYDAIMIKDTHIDQLGGMKNTLQILTDNNDLAVIVEVRSIDELNTVLEYGKHIVNRVLLDNMDNETLQQAVALCKGIIETEASGNINLQTIAAIANTGVDFASVGMITHSAGQVDLSMKAC